MNIPDKHVEHALEILKSSDAAAARAAYEYAEKHLKVVLARETRLSNLKTAAERDAAALCSDAYREALENYGQLAEVYFAAKDRREAAMAVIEAWRTVNANARSMERVR